MNNFKRLSALFSAVVVATMMGCATSTQHESAGAYVEDSVITTKVKAAILGEPTLKSAEINVETFKGRVQLSGFVSSKPEMETAVMVARNVKGVSGVANDMRMK